MNCFKRKLQSHHLDTAVDMIDFNSVFYDYFVYLFGNYELYILCFCVLITLFSFVFLSSLTKAM